MSVYYKECPEFFNRAMQSIWDDQLVKPDQIVLVQDGELTSELIDIVASWEVKIPNILISVPLKNNVGLAGALNAGLPYCCSKYVARMDTDDIALPWRFKSQVKFLDQNSEIDVVGSWVSEIDENGKFIKSVVKYPTTHKKCLSNFRCRDPLAHPATIFRRSFFTKAGQYSEAVPFAEDTLMWYQGFMSGCVFANIPVVCLQFRRSGEIYKRRGDIRKLGALFRYRVLRINPDLGYGVGGNFCALVYLLMQLLPGSVKRILYDKLR